jgi:SAM-dependent methyltransferase
MNWKYKATLQYIFSIIPFGEYMNYFFQTKITRNLPIREIKFKEKLLLAQKHFENFQKYNSSHLSEATFYEFGAGWDMAQPLLFYTMGVDHQIIVDIRRLVRPELINNSIKIIEHLNEVFTFPRLPKTHIKDKLDFESVFLKYYGIEYKAPYDARKTGLSDNSIDCITSTNTLEHIPANEIKAILKECYRILKKDGILSFQIDYQDHYSYFDKNISVYNFLKFNQATWNTFFNPSLHYQNRLRHKEYLQLFSESGFNLLEDNYYGGTPSDIEQIKTVRINKQFSNYDLNELAIRGTLIVLIKC